MYIACCKDGNLLNTIVADSIQFCQQNLAKQFDTFLDVSAFYSDSSKTFQDLQAFLQQHSISIPETQTQPDEIEAIEDDIVQLEQQADVVPTAPLTEASGVQPDPILVDPVGPQS